MTRYIIDKKGLSLLNKHPLDAIEALGSDETIIDETLSYKHLNSVSVILTKEEVKILADASIRCIEQRNTPDVLLAGDYEKYRTKWYPKITKKLITGAGCKVAVLDTGCNLIGTPNVSEVWTNYDFSANFIDANPGVDDIANHGTRVASTIKSSVGLANGCELHILKCLTDAGGADEAAMLAGVDYCIDNNIDIMSISFNYSSVAFNSAIADAIAAGIVVSAATGNNETISPMASPAVLPDVVAINAIYENGGWLYLNITGKQIDFSCSGVECQGINAAGTLGNAWGTSFSAPWFAGAFACFYQMYGLSDNYLLLNIIKKKGVKSIFNPYLGKLINF